MSEPMSDERLNEIHEHVRDAFWGLEVKGDTGWAEVVAKADAPELLAEVARLREALTITDEMVERAAEARYFASYEGPTRTWDKVCEAFPDAVAIFRREARAALKAALENEK